MKVTLPYSPFREPLEWSKKHCPSYISNDLHQDGYNTYDHTRIDYFFGDKEDAIIFILRWGK